VTLAASLQFIRELPKVELHLHLETSLRLRRLAERGRRASGPHDDSPGPSDVTEPQRIADPARFTGYDRLRRLRYLSRAGRIADEWYTPERMVVGVSGKVGEGLEPMLEELLGDMSANGERRPVPLLGADRMLGAMARARARAESRLGISSGFLVTIVRERGPEEAEQRVREAIACRDCGVVGVDLAGDEQNYPPALFARPLGLAREAGLGITVHAGEFAGPASVWTAVYHLGAQRIGHGIRAADDSELLTRLRERGVTLELCPTSNLHLGLCASMGALPLRRLLDAGVSVTVNSDDPMLLGTDLSRELHAVATTFSLGAAEVTRLVTNAARAAFAPVPALP